MIQFLSDNYAIFLALHVLTMAIGLGGATVSDILFFKFLKDLRLSKKEAEVLHVLKDVILTAIFLITVTGIALYIPNAERLNASPLFFVKAVATGVLIINGIALHVLIAPHLIHLNLRHHKRMGREWHRIAFALGSVSICSWYSVFFIAMLKETISWGATPMLSAYVILLLIAITCSQILESILTEKRGENEE